MLQGASFLLWGSGADAQCVTLAARIGACWRTRELPTVNTGIKTELLGGRLQIVYVEVEYITVSYEASNVGKKKYF